MSSESKKLNILISMNSFKGCLSALEGNFAVKQGLKQLPCQVDEVPLVDGGTGSLEAWSLILHKPLENVRCQNPIGEVISAPIIIDNSKAYIEMAQASGIHLVDNAKHDILSKCTYGTGLLINEALYRGCTDIFIGLGGSATHDLGTGILRALGVKFYDKNNVELLSPREMLNIAYIDSSQIHEKALKARFTLLCDVNNTLVGEFGAARVFAPQKGAFTKQLVDDCERLSTIFINYYKSKNINIGLNKGDGAAGGIPALLCQLLNAKVQSGSDFIIKQYGLDKKIDQYDLIITGEGSFDEQSFYGKGPGAIIELASRNSIPVLVLAGAIKSVNTIYNNVSLFSIAPYPCSKNHSLNNAAMWLKNAAYNAVKLLINGYTLGVRA